jgi:hypothetical protein
MPAFAAEAAKVSATTASLAAQSNSAKLFKNMFCAGAASVFTITWAHPVDMVKIRL